ncbi:ubiquinol-cytochrome c reductase complex assembly factor 2, partial [Chelydra serpentina]
QVYRPILRGVVSTVSISTGMLCLGREERTSSVEAVNSFFVLLFGKYPRLKDTSFTGVTVEECKLILATDTGKQMADMKKGKWKKLREKFSAKKTAEEDSKL